MVADWPTGQSPEVSIRSTSTMSPAFPTEEVAESIGPMGGLQEQGQVAEAEVGEARQSGQDEAGAPSHVARAYANQGKLDEAIKWCEKAIAADKLNPAFHYLLATIQQEQVQGDFAVQSLMRALYLDPSFVLAHFALGNLRLSQGRRREAERHFENALELLHAHAQDEILPEAEGLTAGRLSEIIASVRSSLPSAPVAGA